MSAQYKHGERAFISGKSTFVDPEGDMIYDSAAGAFVPADLFSGEAPDVAPIGTKSKIGSFWMAKGDTPDRATEVKTQKVRQNLGTRKVPKGREMLMADEERARAALKADKARWESLGSPGDFDSWVEDKYRSETKREKAGTLTRAARRVSDLVASRNQEGNQEGINPARGVFKGLNVAAELAYQGLGGQDREKRDLEKYMMLRSDKPEPLGIGGTMSAIGDLATQQGGLKTLLREMVNPDDMALNIATAVPVAGAGGKLAALAGKAGNLAIKGGKLSTKVAPLVRAAELTGHAMAHPVVGGGANILADATVGGLGNAVLQNNNFEDDFTSGATAGAAMGLGTTLVGAAGRGAGKMGKRIFREKPAPELRASPIDNMVAVARDAKRETAPDAELGPEDILGNDTFRTIIAKGAKNEGGTSLSNANEFVDKYGHLVVPDLHTNPLYNKMKPDGTPDAEATALSKRHAMKRALDRHIESQQPAEKSSPARKGKQYTAVDLEQTLANYPPLTIGADILPDYLQVGKGGLLKRHYDLKRMRDQGLKMPNGEDIPVHPELDNVNILTQQVDAALAKKQKDIDDQISAAQNVEAKEALKAQRLKNDADAKAQKDELEREGKITELSVKSRLAARGEDVIPGSLTTYIGKLKPEELGLIMDDELVGGGRFDDLMQVMADKMGLEFDELKNLRLATQGNEKLWAEGAKILLDQSKARLEASNRGAQATIDQAVGQQAVREQVASMEDSAATREAMDEASRTKAAEESSLIEEEFLSASDEDAADAFRAVISKNPEKAELLGVKRSTIAAYTNPDNPFHKKAKKELDAKLVDAVKVARERGLPKGFF